MGAKERTEAMLVIRVAKVRIPTFGDGGGVVTEYGGGTDGGIF